MNRRFSTSLAFVLAAMLLSCTKTGTLNEDILPEGKYPLRLTAEMTQPLTRSGGKDAWAGGEELGVNMEGMLSPRKFVVEADGSARPADAGNAIWWKNTDEARITAWHPDIVAPSLDISDQSGGYADFDLVWATAVGRYNQDIVLQFRHRMAKVEFSLAAGDGITEEELASASVKVLGDDEAYFSIGMVGAADKSDGEIVPYYDSATKKFEAMVVPQDMTGKPLIRIGLGGKTFAYTPPTEAAGKLDAGTCHSYAITVKANGLEVQMPWGYNWSDGGEEEVIAARKFIDYTADEVKAGDYIYTDGTTSDGGLRKRYADGTAPVIAAPKPQPVAGKTVAGIVFWTPKDTDPVGRNTPASLADDKIMAKDFPNCTHGLAIALRNVAENMAWQDPKEAIRLFQDGPDFNPADKSSYESIASSEGGDEPINRILGYQNTKVLMAYNAYCKANGKESYVVKPMEKFSDFIRNYPAPDGSTGWFIPSAKELYILCNRDNDNINETYGYTPDKFENHGIVNPSISACGGDVLPRDEKTYCWSSTENAKYYNTEYDIRFGNGILTNFLKHQNNGYFTRAVCAF